MKFLPRKPRRAVAEMDDVVDACIYGRPQLCTCALQHTQQQDTDTKFENVKKDGKSRVHKCLVARLWACVTCWLAVTDGHTCAVLLLCLFDQSKAFGRVRLGCHINRVNAAGFHDGLSLRVSG